MSGPVTLFASTSGLGLGASGALLIVSLVIVLVEIGLNVYVAIDAGRRPEWAFQQAGTQRALWIGLPAGAAAISAVCCLCGGIFGAGFGLLLLVPAGLWLASFRAKVIEAEQRGPSAGYGGFGGPPGGYGGPPGGYPPPGGGQPGGYGQPPGAFPPPPGTGGGFPPPPPSGGYPPAGGPPPPPPPGSPPPPPPAPPSYPPPPPSGEHPPPPPPGGPR